VWIDKNARPVVTVTGSHRHSCLFGAVDINGKQLFRQYYRFNEDAFYKFLKQLSLFSAAAFIMDLTREGLTPIN
jgi:hypothetical protein